MENYGLHQEFPSTAVSLLESPKKISHPDHLARLPEVREFKYENQLQQIIISLINQSHTDDDMKIVNKTVSEQQQFKDNWKTWKIKREIFADAAFKADWDCWEDPYASKLDFNQSMLRDRSQLIAPSPVLRNLQNQCFPGICLIGQIRDNDGSFIKPSEKIRENFLKDIGVIPKNSSIKDIKSFNKVEAGENVIRPSFDRIPGVIGNLKGKLDGTYFEVNPKEGGNISVFFNLKTWEQLVK